MEHMHTMLRIHLVQSPCSITVSHFYASKFRWKSHLLKITKVKVSVAQLCPTLCNPALLSMEFSREEYWSGLPFPSPGDLPDPGIEPRSPALQADSLLSEPPGKK